MAVLNAKSAPMASSIGQSSTGTMESVVAIPARSANPTLKGSSASRTPKFVFRLGGSSSEGKVEPTLDARLPFCASGR